MLCVKFVNFSREVMAQKKKHLVDSCHYKIIVLFGTLRIWQENISLKDLQNKGVCLLKLHIGSQSTGLYGRTVVVLEPRKHLGFSSLPSNNFGPGELADLSKDLWVSASYFT